MFDVSLLYIETTFIPQNQSPKSESAKDPKEFLSMKPSLALDEYIGTPKEHFVGLYKINSICNRSTVIATAKTALY